jgi:hypothetical protein
MTVKIEKPKDLASRVAAAVLPELARADEPEVLRVIRELVFQAASLALVYEPGVPCTKCLREHELDRGEFLHLAGLAWNAAEAAHEKVGLPS